MVLIVMDEQYRQESMESGLRSFTQLDNPIGVSDGPDSRPAFDFSWHGRTVGKLEIHADGLHFVGDADESARVMFKILAEKMDLEYHEDEA